MKTDPGTMTEPYVLVFDGGSIGNPGPAYGSVMIQAPGQRTRPPLRFDFGHGTNNQAEYQSLIAGLGALLERLGEEGIAPEGVEVEVRGDSRLVINQLQGNWKIKNPQLRSLHDEVLELSMRFRAIQFVHQRRTDTLRALGH